MQMTLYSKQTFESKRTNRKGQIYFFHPHFTVASLLSTAQIISVLLFVYILSFPGKCMLEPEHGWSQFLQDTQVQKNISGTVFNSIVQIIKLLALNFPLSNL